jgi:hypothetical protein
MPLPKGSKGQARTPGRNTPLAQFYRAIAYDITLHERPPLTWHNRIPVHYNQTRAGMIGLPAPATGACALQVTRPERFGIIRSARDPKPLSPSGSVHASRYSALFMRVGGIGRPWPDARWSPLLSAC